MTDRAPDACSTPRRLLRVWDLPTRLFHWSLVLAVSGAFLSAWIGGAAMDWHFRCGYAVLALLSFRLLWGFAGGHWSRWRQVLRSPAATWRYLRGQSLPEDQVEGGHNPLGALSVLAMMGALAVQVGSGLIADNEIDLTGPLVAWVSGETSLQWTAYHQRLGQFGLYALLALHVGSVLFHERVRRHPLVRAMCCGDRPGPADLPDSRDTLGSRLLALGLIGACAAGVAWLVG